MDPNSSGGNPPDANPPSSFASTISAAFAHITGKDKEGEKQTDLSQAPAAETTAPLAKPAPEHPQESLFSMYNTDSSADASSMPKEGEKLDSAPSAGEVMAETNAEESSFAKDGMGKAEEDQDVEMKEEYESSIGAEDVAPAALGQLQAVVGEQTMKVKVKVDDEIVEDDLVVNRNGMCLFCSLFTLLAFLVTILSYI